MKRLLGFILFLLLLVGSFFFLTPTSFATSTPTNLPPTALPYGHDTCVNGYVWREAYGSNDHVCVVPATRTQAAYDNSQAASRIDPNGAYGPDTCINGYVWREASKGIDDSVTDHVCVDPATRTQAAYDNTQAPNLRVLP